MEEVRRFLRYTLPGLATLLVVFGIVGILRVKLPPWVSDKEILAWFVGVFVASGAIGYLMANLYFGLRWLPLLKRFLAIDHKEIIKNLESQLEVWGPSRKWDLKNLTKFDSWSIITHYSVSHSKVEKEMKAISSHCRTMVDITHGLGSLCTGLCVLVIPLFFYIQADEEQTNWFIFGLLLVLIIFLWYSFRRSLLALQVISNTAFITSIIGKYKWINKENSNSQKQKVVIYYEKDEPISEAGGTSSKRSISFWVVIVFLIVSMLLLLMGQTIAIFNYEFAVKLGLQEDVKEVSVFGVQINRAFGAGDTFIYLPLMAMSLVGLFLKKRWSLVTTASVMGISVYWATVVAFMLFFLLGVPNYNLVPGLEYWLFISAYIIFGIWGVIYLIYRGDKVIN